MHYTGMASALYYVSDNPTTDASEPTVSSSTAVFASLIASSFFLYIIVFMVIADLRMWFYTQSKKLREINDIMQVLEASTIQCHASRLAIEKYKRIREQDQIESERLKQRASNILPTHFLSKKVKIQPFLDGTSPNTSSRDVRAPFFGMHAAEPGGPVTPRPASENSQSLSQSRKTLLDSAKLISSKISLSINRPRTINMIAGNNTLTPKVNKILLKNVLS